MNKKQLSINENVVEDQNDLKTFSWLSYKHYPYSQEYFVPTKHNPNHSISHGTNRSSLPFSLSIPCLTISESLLRLPMETILSPYSLSPILNPKPSSSKNPSLYHSTQPRSNLASLSKPISLSLKTPSPPKSLRSSLPFPSTWFSHLQHGLAAVAISLALNFSPLLAGHNALASEFDVLSDGPPKETHLVDDAGVLSRVTKSDLKRLLTDLEMRKNFHIDFVTVRKLTSKADAFEYADQVLERWYPTVEDGNNKGIVVLVTSQKEGAITGGPAFIQAVGENILDATVTENLPVLATDEKYNEAIYSSAKRLVAAIDGLPDTGGPSFKDNKRESNFKTREETEEKRGQFTLVVGVLCREHGVVD